MSALNKLLDKAKESRSLKLDADLAAALGVVKSAVSNWRNGRAYPDEVACARLADMTGEPLARVLGVIGEARAVTKDAKAVWRRLASAAALLLLIGAAGAPSPAAAQAFDSASNSRPMYIMSIFRRASRACRVLFRLPASFAPVPA